MVLLVDDQIMIGEAVRRSLAGEANLEFNFCSDPKAALTTPDRIAPTVILEDLVMPGIDGLTLVREYRDQEYAGHCIVNSRGTQNKERCLCRNKVVITE